jgi:hypothetical protein
VSLNDDSSAEFSSDVERHELHFSFVDGRVVDVCSSPLETSATLNIKKGILSAFQMSSEDWSKSQNITEVYYSTIKPLSSQHFYILTFC